MHPAALLSRFNSKFFSEKKMKMKCLYNIYASPIKSPTIINIYSADGRLGLS